MNQDINGFVEGGLPILGNINNQIVINTFYKNPLKQDNFIIDILGNSRLNGALTIAGALTGATTGAFSAGITATTGGFSGAITGASLALGTGNILTANEIGGILTRINKGWYNNLDMKNFPYIDGRSMEEIFALKSDITAGQTEDRNRANHTGVEVLPAGTTAAGTAPIKLTSGTNLTIAELGAIEFDGNNFYATVNVDGTTESSTATTNASDNPTSFDFDVSISRDNTFISYIGFHLNGIGGSYDVTGTVKVNGVTIATKTSSLVGDSGTVNAIQFVATDYSTPLMNGQTAVVFLSVAGASSIQRKTGYTYSGTNFTITNDGVGGAHGVGDSQTPIKLTNLVATRKTITLS